MNLGKQVISAGAESTGLFSELATLTADQRSKLREIMQTSCEIQGSATLADGQAQKSALDDEADIRGTMAAQSFIEASTTAGSELIGMAVEKGTNKFIGGSKTETNLSRAEALETKLNGGTKQPTAMIKATTEGQEAKSTQIVEKSPTKAKSANKTSDQGIEMDTVGGNEKQRIKEEAEATPTKKPDLNADDVNNSLPVPLKDSEGNMRDLGDEKRPGNFTDEEKALIEHFANNPEHPKAVAMRKQASKAVKRYRKQVDSNSATAQRFGTLSKDFVRAGNLAAKGTTDLLLIKQSQMHEADEKLNESQARYLSDTNGSLMRQAGEVAGNLTNHIQNINQARKEMFESNRA